jgi:hypothetical protein
MTIGDSANRYPLSWPVGWKRTSPHYRRRALFKDHGGRVSIATATARLEAELDRLGAAHPLLSTNVELRLDGRPRSDRMDPSDPGAAIYFRMPDGRGTFQDRVLACDKWDRVADNVAAIAAHVEAIRAVDRYGVGTLDQAFAGYAALPEGRRSYLEVLGFDKAPTSRAQVEERYRELAKERHPDVGGSEDAFKELGQAKDDALHDLPA